MEPHLAPVLAGALHWTDPIATERSAGGSRAPTCAVRAARRAHSCRAMRAACRRTAPAGRCTRPKGRSTAGAAVIALGPWADVVTRALGYDLPLAVKRGYHMHYRAAGDAQLNHPVLDAERGYFLAPMRARHPADDRRGVRAARRDPHAGAARPRRADRARPVPARRAARHRAVDGRAAVHAGHAADHRPGAAPRESLVRVRPRAPRPDARPRDRPADRRDGDAARRRSSIRRRTRRSASADGDLRHRRRAGLLRRAAQAARARRLQRTGPALVRRRPGQPRAEVPGRAALCARPGRSARWWCSATTTCTSSRSTKASSASARTIPSTTCSTRATRRNSSTGCARGR